MNFIDNKDGTISDTDTGLMWQQITAPGTYTWDYAMEYCKSLNLAGFTDWRLPTIKELVSIVEYSRYSPAINTDYFLGTLELHYWSSTTYACITSTAWLVDFNIGDIFVNNKLNNYYVRAVRGGHRPEVGKEEK